MELVGTMMVGQYFEPNPETELQFTGAYLKDDMVVLIGDERYRESLPLILINHSFDKAMIANRWAKVSNFKIVKAELQDRIVFTATYEDGSTAERDYPVGLFWYVKIDSF